MVSATKEWIRVKQSCISDRAFYRACRDERWPPIRMKEDSDLQIEKEDLERLQLRIGSRRVDTRIWEMRTKSNEKILVEIEAAKGRLGIIEVCKRIKRSYQTVKRLIISGELKGGPAICMMEVPGLEPSYFIGMTVDLDSIDEYLKRQNEPENLLTPRQFAQQAELHHTTVESWRRKKYVPQLRRRLHSVNGKIPESELEAYLNARNAGIRKRPPGMSESEQEAADNRFTIRMLADKIQYQHPSVWNWTKESGSNADCPFLGEPLPIKTDVWIPHRDTYCKGCEVPPDAFQKVVDAYQTIKEKFVSPLEFAKIFDVTKATVQNWLKFCPYLGQAIPKVEIGHRYYIHKDYIERLKHAMRIAEPIRSIVVVTTPQKLVYGVPMYEAMRRLRRGWYSLDELFTEKLEVGRFSKLIPLEHYNEVAKSIGASQLVASSQGVVDLQETAEQCLEPSATLQHMPSYATIKEVKRVDGGFEAIIVTPQNVFERYEFILKKRPIGEQIPALIDDSQVAILQCLAPDIKTIQQDIVTDLLLSPRTVRNKLIGLRELGLTEKRGKGEILTPLGVEFLKSRELAETDG